MDDPSLGREAQPAPAGRESERRRASQQRRRRQSVVIYIFMLFLAALALMLLTLLMERRQNEESINDLTQTITGLRDSVSAMQSVERLYQDKTDLLAQVDGLEAQLEDLRAQAESQAQEAARLNERLDRTVRAMDLFWQIDEGYVRGRYALCRQLIESLQDQGLEDALPRESTTGNDRFSPYDRYREIWDKLY